MTDYFYRILIIVQYYLKSHTSNETSICSQCLYSVSSLGNVTYSGKNMKLESNSNLNSNPKRYLLLACLLGHQTNRLEGCW